MKVGEPFTLVAVASDPDNLPARRERSLESGGRRRAAAARRPRASAGVPTTFVDVPSSGPGLRLSWIVYRGKAAEVTFSPEQMKTWTDTRGYANSPWSPPYIIPEPPPDGKWSSGDLPGAGNLRAPRRRQRRSLFT